MTDGSSRLARRCVSGTGLFWVSLSRQLKQDAADRVAARVDTDWKIIENHVYHRLLLLYAGKLGLAELEQAAGTGIQNATQAYGICNHFLIRGDRPAAIARMHRLLDGGQWPAFGYIAAEADLLRMGESR